MSDILIFPLALPVAPTKAEIVPISADQCAISLAPGVWMSVQPDGSVQTRSQIGPWEACRVVGQRTVCFDGTGDKFYFLIDNVV